MNIRELYPIINMFVEAKVEARDIVVKELGATWISFSLESMEDVKIVFGEVSRMKRMSIKVIQHPRVYNQKYAGQIRVKLELGDKP